MVGGKGRVLITGGAGFIGSYTADELYGRGYSIRILDNLSPSIHFGKWPEWVKPEYEKVLGDVRSRKDLTRALRGVDYVVHLAALTDLVPNYAEFFDVNVTGTALLYQVIREEKMAIKKVVAASSQFVYGEGRWKCSKHGVVVPGGRLMEQLTRGEWEPKCPKCGRGVKFLEYEEWHQDPPNHYAISKYSAELVALKLGRLNGIPSVAMRYSVVQGPRQSVKNMYSGAIRIFSLGAMNGHLPIIYEDGEQLRDFVSVHDVARANAMVLEDSRADYENFNVGGGRGRSVVELARAVMKVWNVEGEVAPSGLFRVGDSRHAVSSIEKLAKLGWEPKYTMEDSVREYAAWLKGQKLDRDYWGEANEVMRKSGMVKKTSIPNEMSAW